MIEALESLDRSIIVFINGQHSLLLDQIMWFISGPWLVFIITSVCLLFHFSELYQGANYLGSTKYITHYCFDGSAFSACI